MNWKHMAVEQLDWYGQTLLRPRLEGLTDGAEVALLRDLYAHRFGGAG